MSNTTAPTLMYDPGEWAPPVETRESLWDLAPDGQMCFVKSENRIYVRRGNRWHATRSAQSA